MIRKLKLCKHYKVYGSDVEEYLVEYGYDAWHRAYKNGKLIYSFFEAGLFLDYLYHLEDSEDCRRDVGLSLDQVRGMLRELEEDEAGEFKCDFCDNEARFIIRIGWLSIYLCKKHFLEQRQYYILPSGDVKPIRKGIIHVKPSDKTVVITLGDETYEIDEKELETFLYQKAYKQ